MAEAQTHVFRVSLSRKVYRDFEILSAKNLYDLAGEIVRVFGFDFDHAFGFYSKLTGDVFGSPVKYELFADMGESEARSVKRTRIVEAFPTVGGGTTSVLAAGGPLSSFCSTAAGSSDAGCSPDPFSTLARYAASTASASPVVRVFLRGRDR